MKSVPRLLLLCPTVFVLVFLCGLFYLLNRVNVEKSTAETAQETADILSQDSLKTGKLPPLNLPACFKGKPCPGDKGWEFSGYAAANFVSTRGILNACLQNQSWKAAKEIQIGTNVNPKVLLTFERGDYEVIIQLSRRDVNKTDFAYRREKKQIIGKGLTK